MRGYVMIEVMGFSVERFINMAVHRGIYLWDVQRGGNAATMKVSVKGFKLLKPCAKKTKCKIRIAKKRGVPFVAYRYRKRKLLVAGALAFVALLFFLSSFVWLLQVEGNERISSAEIMEFLESEGLAVGTFKSSVNEKALEKALMAQFPDISWINVYIKGTRASIRLRETIPAQPIVDRTSPCDIVAAKDGLVTSVAVSAGTPVAKPGDVVRKGEVLVTGQLLIGTEDTGFRREYVHAQAEVRAKAYYEISLFIPYEYIIKNYTGEVKKDYSIIFFETGINLLKPNISFQNYDKITNRTQLNFGQDYPLPAVMVTDEYREYTPQILIRTVEEAKEMAGKLITAQIIRGLPVEADVLQKDITYTETDTGLQVYTLITTDEPIGAAQEIISRDEAENAPEASDGFDQAQP